jgi:hypothetical protein
LDNFIGQKTINLNKKQHQKNLRHQRDLWETKTAAAALQNEYSFIHAVSAKVYFENIFPTAMALCSAKAEHYLIQRLLIAIFAE